MAKTKKRLIEEINAYMEKLFPGEQVLDLNKVVDELTALDIFEEDADSDVLEGLLKEFFYVAAEQKAKYPSSTAIDTIYHAENTLLKADECWEVRRISKMVQELG